MKLLEKITKTHMKSIIKKTTNPTTQKETRKITKKKWPNYTEEIRKSNADIYLSHFPLTSVVSEYVSNVSFSKRLKI